MNFDTRTGISAIPLAMEAFALGLDTYADKIDDTIGRIEAVPDPLSEFEADRVVLRLKSHAKAIREIKTTHIDFIEAVLLKLEDEVEILKGPSLSSRRRLSSPQSSMDTDVHAQSGFLPCPPTFWL